MIDAADDAASSAQGCAAEGRDANAGRGVRDGKAQWAGLGREVVIHDVRLIGDADVPHQIDVKIDVAGTHRHVIIECKDFDIAGGKVDLAIVKGFWAVILDTKADQGIIITCNGFTGEAAKFAKAKGIKLAMLRAFEDKEREDRIKTVIAKLIFIAPIAPRVTISLLDDNDAQRLKEAMAQLTKPGGFHIADAVHLVRSGQSVHFNKYLTAEMNRAIVLKDTSDQMEVRVPSDGRQLKVRDYESVSFNYIDVTFDVHRDERELVITSDRIAELILSGFQEDDVIIFGDQIERGGIDADTGEVHMNVR